MLFTDPQVNGYRPVQCSAMQCIVMHCTAMGRSVVQCSAVQCSVKDILTFVLCAEQKLLDIQKNTRISDKAYIKIKCEEFIGV